MKTCKDCAHWRKVEGEFMGDCDSDMVITDNYSPETIPKEERADDSVSVYYTLSTGPDFGCIHHTKETSEMSINDLLDTLEGMQSLTDVGEYIGKLIDERKEK